MTANEDLARRIADLRADVDGLTRTSNLGNASVSQGEGQTALNLSDVLGEAVDANTIIPGLTDQLAALNEALIANDAAVQVAYEAATQAGIDGVAAGELAGAAADDALEKAQEALDAAAAAGGGATYSGSAPTASTPGTQGQQWFVWDSNYKITAYYVYDSSNGWTLTQITDAVLGNINAGSITSGYIGADRIAAASLTAAVLAADTITSREIAANAILARNIKAGEITATHIAGSTITGDKIAANTVTAANIAAGTITANEIAAGSITANEINLDSLNGRVITGATIRSAGSGRRVEVIGDRIDVYGTNTKAGFIQGHLGNYDGIMQIGGGTGGTATDPQSIYVGNVKSGLPAASGLEYVAFSTETMYATRGYIDQASAGGLSVTRAVTASDLIYGPTGTSLLVPTTIASATPGNWGASASGSNTATTFSFNSTVARPVRIKYGSIIDPGGGNLGGSWSLRLNGVQLGISEGLSTPGPTKGSWWQQLSKPGMLVAGTNTIQLIVDKESSSATIYGNRSTIEVEG